MEPQTIQLPAAPEPETKATAPRTAPSFERCRARTKDGRRCRLHSDPATGLCPRHRHIAADPPEDTDLLSEFESRFGDLTTALTICDFLRNVAYLLVQNKMSNRRAAVLTNICGHLLRTVPLIDKELGRRYEPDYVGFSPWRRDDDTSSTAESADRPSATHSLPSDSPVAQPSSSVAPAVQSAACTPTAPQSPSHNPAAATTSSQRQPAAKPPAPPAPSQQQMPQPADASPPPQQTFPTAPPNPALREEVYKAPPEGDDILGIFRPPPANLKRDPRYAPVWHQPSRCFTDG